jgi:hypothetical protein
MSLIDGGTPEAFFANLLLPLKRHNASRRVQYFAREPDQAAETYWQEIATRTGGFGSVPADSDPAGLLDQLAEYWRASGDPALPRLLPYLKQLREALAAKPLPLPPTARIPNSRTPSTRCSSLQLPRQRRQTRETARGRDSTALGASC